MRGRRSLRTLISTAPASWTSDQGTRARPVCLRAYFSLSLRARASQKYIWNTADPAVPGANPGKGGLAWRNIEKSQQDQYRKRRPCFFIEKSQQACVIWGRECIIEKSQQACLHEEILRNTSRHVSSEGGRVILWCARILDFSIILMLNSVKILVGNTHEIGMAWNWHMKCHLWSRPPTGYHYFSINLFKFHYSLLRNDGK